MAESSQLVQKLWNYCNILRDDGLSYGDYVEQLTFDSVAPAPSGFALRSAQSDSLASSGSALLFLKMAGEQSRLRDAKRPACYLSGFCRDAMETTFSNRRPLGRCVCRVDNVKAKWMV